MLAYKTNILNSNPVRSFGLVSSAEEHDSYESNVENVLKGRHAEAVLITLSCRGYLDTVFHYSYFIFDSVHFLNERCHLCKNCAHEHA